MPIILFLKELARKKKVLAIWMIIGFILFAVFGYIQRNNINSELVYCSQSKILSEAEKEVWETGGKSIQIMMDSFDPYDKNAAVITSDTVLSDVQLQLEKENITLSIDEIKQMLTVEATTNVINITVCGDEPDLVQKICELCTVASFQELTTVNEDSTSILNHASEPFTVVVSDADNILSQGEKTKVIAKQEFTPITKTYVVKEMIKYGVLGAILFFLLVAFIYSIKIIFRENK